ncbi:MAG: hypothetical protein KF866_02625 [Phycisphaeraceae bacterium]|nr:hypothetical protein [Phycisphaeraceae bacterium]
MSTPGHTPPPADISTTGEGLRARDAAMRLLASQARRYPDLSIAVPDETGLETRDAALAHAIYEQSVSRWITLAWIVGRFSKQPFHELEASMKAVLLAGSAQLLFFDRLPVHAVIDTSVELAKRRIRPKAGAMVNAVLRRVARLVGPTRQLGAYAGEANQVPLAEGGALNLTEAVLPDDSSERFAVAVGLPGGLWNRWREAFGEADAHMIALHTLIRPPVVVNIAHATAPVSVSEGSALAPHSEPGRAVYVGSPGHLRKLLTERNDLWVQDAASAAPVELASHLQPGLIVDLCAGRGTKTRQLVAMFPNARIVASDADAARLRDLAETFRNSQQVRVVPLATVRQRCLGKADLVLLDVPCSNTGVLARRIEAKHRAGSTQLERLTAAQRQIIADAIPLLAPGGHVLYSTCSIDTDENELQSHWMQRWHSFKLACEQFRLPRGNPGGSASEYADASYAALLVGGR